MQLDIPAATTAQGKKDRMSTKPSSPPISSHPAFPAAVALWFALLMGLGFFVLPASTLESLVETTGIAAILPAAAPPLGATARLAISGLAALVGVALGLFIAWRVVLGQGASPTTDDDDDAARQTARLRAARDSLTQGEKAPDQDDAPLFIQEPEPNDERVADVSGWGSWREDMGAESFDELGDDRDDEPVNGVHIAEETSPGEIERGDEPQDDDHRQAADMLVAGLPQIDREKLEDAPIAAWLRDEADETDTDVGQTAERPEPRDMIEPHAPPFEPAATTQPPLAVPVDEPDPQPTPAPTGEAAEPSVYDRLEDRFESFSLDQMVGRLGRAMAKYEAVRAEQANADDDPVPQVEAPRAEVIDFQRRDRSMRGADANRIANPPEPQPQQSLREALEKLTRVSSQS